MWLAYILAMFLFDFFLPAPKPHLRFVNYYIANCTAALVFLGLSYWKKGYDRFGRWFTLILLLLISVLPIVMNHFIAIRLPPGPMANAEGMALRQLPVLFIALVLIAWMFRFYEIILFSLATAFLDLVTVTIATPVDFRQLQIFLFINLVRTTSFLAVGFFINGLISRLHEQQKSLQKANKQLTTYTNMMEELAVTRERNRLGRELHDTLAHSLTALSVQLETLKAYWDLDPEKAKHILEQSLELTRTGAAETRRAVKSLRASPLEDIGLVLALKQLLEDASQRGNFSYDISLPKQIMRLNEHEEQAIYRIIQEVVENIIKHAQAAYVKFEMSQSDNRLLFILADDGIGFSTKTISENQFGISGIKERAAEIGGSIDLRSKVGEGTRVSFEFVR